jgi:hypothetical protein
LFLLPGGNGRVRKWRISPLLPHHEPRRTARMEEGRWGRPKGRPHSWVRTGRGAAARTASQPPARNNEWRSVRRSRALHQTTIHKGRHSHFRIPRTRADSTQHKIPYRARQFRKSATGNSFRSGQEVVSAEVVRYLPDLPVIAAKQQPLAFQNVFSKGQPIRGNCTDSSSTLSSRDIGLEHDHSLKVPARRF